MNNITDYTYTRQDFDTTAPYEYIEGIKDPFQRTVEAEKLADYARTLKFTQFRKALSAYRESLKAAAGALMVPESGLMDFSEQTQELQTGIWTADDYGVRKGMPDKIACPHPIYPVLRLRNIDTGELRVRLAYRRGDRGRGPWQFVTTDFDTVSNAKNIVTLSRIGISVTSGERAQNLVEYLADVMDLNYDVIPERKSVSRLGWTQEGFSPYVEDVEFDGNANFEQIFRSVRERGNYDKWKETAWMARSNSITARLILAASFASVLVEPLECLPFFVHLWGMDSGTGKTVGQMLAVSVWGNPALGSPLFPTFKATSTGFEIIAGFLNSLPVVIDELQLAKDNRGKTNFNVYELASGIGKLRATKTLGLAKTASWANCFITSGETPIVSDSDGAGAVNRVIEIECKADAKVILNGHDTASSLKSNYGFAGREFVQRLTGEGQMERARGIYNTFYSEALQNDTTEKQAMAAAVILTGDKLSGEWIWSSHKSLTVSDIAEFLKSKEAVSAADRGYNYMCDWVAQNANKLQGSAENGDVYGDMGKGADDGWVYIIRSVWDKACAETGISSPALLSHLKSKGLIQASDKGFTKTKRINKIPTNCVVMRLKSDYEDLPDAEPTPFV